MSRYPHHVHTAEDERRDQRRSAAIKELLAKPRALKEHDAAAYLGVSINTMRQWRTKGNGPRYYKLGGWMIRYDVVDLDAYTDEHKKNSARG